MADKQIQYTITANASPFAAGMQQVGQMLQGVSQRFGATGRDWKAISDGMSAQMGAVANNVRSSVTAMGGHFSTLLEGVGATRAGFVGLMAVAAGLAASKAVSATAEMTEGAMDLARVLGSSTNVAQKWRIALEDVGAQQSDLEEAAKGMARQLKENEAEMNALGLVTRDAAGQFRPMNDLLADGLAVLNRHKEGADRALAGQHLFGRGVDASSKLLLVNNQVLNDATETMADLGLEVGANAVAALKEYDAATDRAGFSVTGMVTTIGKILMPVLTDLVNLFNAVMPAAITVVKGALGGLTTAFHAVKNGVIVAWEIINAMVVAVAEPIRALAEAIGRGITGDFKGAAEAIKGVGNVISGSWGQAMDRMAESSQRTRDRINAIWNADTAAGETEGQRGTKGFKAPPKDDTKGKKDFVGPQLGDVQYYELMLAREKQFAAEKDALREYTKQQELAYWQEVLATAELQGKDRVAIARKVTDLIVQVKREEATKFKQLDALAQDEKLAAGLYAIDLARMEAAAKFELGAISSQQLLEQERQLEEKRAEIRRQYLIAKQAEIDPERDPVAYAQISAQIEEEERRHRLRLRDIKREVDAEAKDNPIERMWQGAEAAMQRGVSGMLQGTMTLRQGLTSIWQGIRAAITGEIAKIIAAEIAGFVKQRAIALGKIAINAVTAGSGAASAMASIPYVGPILAIAAMGAMLAAVGGLSSKVPSAARGFDIPAGTNPLTQLHEKEMVLPAEHADVIRGLAGGGADAARPINVTIHALDGASVKRVLMDNPRELAAALRNAERGFH